METLDEELDDINNLVSEKEDIDKKKFEEIVNHVFVMFNDEKVSIEELWNLLLKIAIGPARKIAKETLEELESKSDNQLDIIRYHHLLSMIEESEYCATHIEENAEEYT